MGQAVPSFFPTNLSELQPVCTRGRPARTGMRDNMRGFRNLARDYCSTLLLCLLIITLLTILAPSTASMWQGSMPESLKSWAQKERFGELRFDDYIDGITLANVVYRGIAGNLSFWTYFVPANNTEMGWGSLLQAVDAKNHLAIAKDIKEQKGAFIYRYWTGHMVLTTFLFYLFPEVPIAAKFTHGFVLVAFFLYVLAWREKFGALSSVLIFSVFIVSGSLRWESFFNPTWGLGAAFLTAGFTGYQLRRGGSYVVPAVAGAVFTNWVGYDHVFDAMAFSLPFFLICGEKDGEPGQLAAPLIFVTVFLVTTAAMMALRAPIMYLDGHNPGDFLRQVYSQTLYRTQGQLNQRESFAGAEISRAFAMREALPYLNGYLFKLGGVLTPKPQGIFSYVLLTVSPWIAALSICAFRRGRFDKASVSFLMVFLLVVMFFHVMFLLFVNHAVVHPWMDCRHMLFCFAISWGLLIGTPFLADQNPLHGKHSDESGDRADFSQDRETVA